MSPTAKRNSTVFLLSAAAGFIVGKIFDPDPHCPTCPVCGASNGGAGPAPSGGGGGGGGSAAPLPAGGGGGMFPNFPLGSAASSVIDSDGNVLSSGPFASSQPQASSGPFSSTQSFVTQPGSGPVPAGASPTSAGVNTPNATPNSNIQSDTFVSYEAPQSPYVPTVMTRNPPPGSGNAPGGQVAQQQPQVAPQTPRSNVVRPQFGTTARRR